MKQIKKTILTLVALLAVTTGAWADGTVTVTELKASEMPTSWENNNNPVKATDLPGFTAVTRDEAKALGAPAAEGEIYVFYAISNNKFIGICWNNGVLEDNDGNIGLGAIYALKDAFKFYYTGSAAATVPITWDATAKTATIASMPAGNVTVNVEYYPGMLTLPASLTGGTLSVEGLTAPFTKLDVPATWENDNTLLSADNLPGLKELTDAEAQNWTDVPSGYVILIYGFDGTKAKLAPYFDGELDFPGSEEVTLSQLKDQSAVSEIYYSSEAQMPAGFETDGKNIFVADKTEFKVKAVPADGFRLASLMFGEQDITGQVDADGIATLTMPEGNIDLELTATFAEITYNVEFAEGVNPEPPAEPEWTASPNADVKKGQTVTVTYTGDRKVIGVKAEKKASAPTLKDALADGATVVITYTWYGSNVTTFTYTNNGGTYTGNTTGENAEYFGNGMSKDGTTLNFTASIPFISDANVSIDFYTDTNEYVISKGSGFTSFTISVNGTDLTSQLKKVK